MTWLWWLEGITMLGHTCCNSFCWDTTSRSLQRQQTEIRPPVSVKEVSFFSPGSSALRTGFRLGTHLETYREALREYRPEMLFLCSPSGQSPCYAEAGEVTHSLNHYRPRLLSLADQKAYLGKFESCLKWALPVPPRHGPVHCPTRCGVWPPADRKSW